MGWNRARIRIGLLLAMLAGCGSRSDDLLYAAWWSTANPDPEPKSPDTTVPSAAPDASTDAGVDASVRVDATPPRDGASSLDAPAAADAPVLVDAGSPDAATTSWLHVWGGPSSDEVDDLAVHGDAIYVGGSGQITNEIGPVASYVARFDRNGTRVWARLVVGGGYSYLHPHLAVAGDGSVYVSSVFSGTDVDFDPGAGVDLFSGERGTPFVTKFGPNGEYVWTRTWPELHGSDNNPHAVVLPSGAVVIVGSFLSTPASANQLDAFALKVTSAGDAVWKTTWGANRDDYPAGVVADGTGGLLVCGSYTEYTNYPTVGDMPPSHGMDNFVLRLDGLGNRTWTRTWGGDEDDLVRSCRLGADGTLAVTGVIRGSGVVHLVNGLTTPFSTTSYDAFLYLLESSGDHRAFVTWGGYGYDFSDGLTFTTGGDVVVSGSTVTSAFGGGGTVTGSVVRFTKNGAYVSHLAWGGESSVALAVGTAWDGTMIVGGTFDGTVTFPGLATIIAPYGEFTTASLFKRPFP